MPSEWSMEDTWIDTGAIEEDSHGLGRSVAIIAYKNKKDMQQATGRKHREIRQKDPGSESKSEND